MRRDLDAYMTPAWQTEALLSRVPLAGNILEPCAGDKAISNVLERDPRNWLLTNDIDKARNVDMHFDATDPYFWLAMKHCPGHADPPPDWVITNPPFLSAFQILTGAHGIAQLGVAMLLRISFLEPTKERGAWLAENPPGMIIVLPRWSYTGDGKSDSTTTAWMIWFNTLRFNRGIYIHPEKPRVSRKARVIIPAEVQCGLD